MDSGRWRCAQRSSIATGAPASVRKNTMGSPKMVRGKRLAADLGIGRGDVPVIAQEHGGSPCCRYYPSARPRGRGRFSFLPALAGEERQALSFSRKVRAHAEQRTPRKTSLQTRREAERREAHQPGAASTSDAARALSPVFPLREDRGPGLHRALDLKKWSGRARLSAPHRGIRGFWPRLGSGRASWNHRMQTGGPSPAPVQRAPRSPARAGRDDAQAARERSVWPRSTRTAPAPPSRSTLAKGVPLRAGFWLGNCNGDESQGQCRFIRDAS